jgi:hypothetical protein
MIERRDKLILVARETLLGLCDPVAEMKMIDALQRLGVSYHFKEEIDLKLQELSSQKFDINNLHNISLQFRLLRQDRCYISCGKIFYVCLVYLNSLSYLPFILFSTKNCVFYTT